MVNFRLVNLSHVKCEFVQLLYGKSESGKTVIWYKRDSALSTTECSVLSSADPQLSLDLTWVPFPVVWLPWVLKKGGKFWVVRSKFP